MADEAAHPYASLPTAPQSIQKISLITDGTGDRAYWSHLVSTLHGLPALGRRERYAGLLVASVAAVVVGGTFAAFIAVKEPDARRFAPIAGVLLAIPVLMTGVNRGGWTRWRRSVHALERGQLKKPIAVTVSVTPDGYTTEFADSSRTIRWSGISHIMRLDRWIVICQANGGDADAVPISAFPSDADAEAWFLRARELLDQSGHGPLARVRAAIDRGPVRCGKCGYNLVGARATKCPECGFELSQIQIELWRTLQMPFRRQLRSMWGPQA